MNYNNRLEILSAVEKGELDIDEAISMIQFINSLKEKTSPSIIKGAESQILQIISHLVKLDVSEININADFNKYGFDSVTFIELADNINSALGSDLTPAIFFEYSTIKSLIDYLNENYGELLSDINRKETAASDNENTETQVLQIISHLVKLDISEININADFNKYGFDSVTFIELADNINSALGSDLTPAIFFEYPTIKSLLNYLVEECGIKLKNNKAKEQKRSVAKSGPTKKISSRFIKSMPFTSENNSSLVKEPIAIIGIDGVFPQSNDLQTFWDNLEQQKDLITEVPESRWNWKEFYGNPRESINKTLSKWGGFIDDVDKFDAAFFGISPREAEFMDPQQRIFLQVTWKAIENAGYKPSVFSGTNTGVFVGVGSNDHLMLLAGSRIKLDAFIPTGVSHSIIANRISYLLNISGPSEPIDTACSSSLVAIHRAVEAIQNGECNMAIAGGVNVALSPFSAISLNNAGMLSSDGRCKTFDKSANGYVRGEGAGALILKPLSKAEKDNDYIYAVIKGSAENHGGRAKSITAPNPNAQAELLKKAYKKAAVSPDTITYIEAHGSGTSLGDPIEINGLKKAFSELYTTHSKKMPPKPYCAVSSVKTNIGHLEMAAGIAGVLKVILAMKNKKIPGLANFNELNPYIMLENSPFYIAEKTEQWKHLKDENGTSIPYRAGISSFGFGGSNSHIVLEEYQNKIPEGSNDNRAYTIVPLSAKKASQLKEYALELSQFLKANKSSYTLHQVAHILQTGRDEYNERLAVITDNIEQLITLLDEYSREVVDDKSLIYGSITKMSEKQSDFTPDNLQEKDDYIKAASHWLSGGSLDWSKITNKATFKKAPLPSYPFEKRNFRLNELSLDILKDEPAKDSIDRLHPLLSSNISTLLEQKFTTQFKGDEFYLRDHVVGENQILPGVAYIEMAREAGELAGAKRVKSIKNIIWSSPIIVDQKPISSYITLSPQKKLVDYRVYSHNSEGQTVIHSQGKLDYTSPDQKQEPLNIKEIKERCVNEMSHQECYDIFRSKQLNYGSSFQTINRINYNSNEVISELQLAEHLNKSKDDFFLHPSLLDAALQTTLGFLSEDEVHSPTTFLPFSLQQLDIYDSLPPKCYAYATYSGSSKGRKSSVKIYNIVLLDEKGKLLVKLKDFSVRAYQLPKKTTLNSQPQAASLSLPESIMYYQNSWFESKIDNGKTIEETLLLFEADDMLYNKLVEDGVAKDKIVRIQPGSAFKKINKNLYELSSLESTDYKQLFDCLNKESIKIEHLLFIQSNDEFKAAELDSQLSSSIHPLFFLTKAIIQAKLKEKLRLTYIYPENPESPQPIFFGISGFAKTINQESPKCSFKTVGCDNFSIDYLKKIAIDEIKTQSDEVEVRYTNHKRYVKVISQVKNWQMEQPQTTLVENGSYLITGGLGGLGLIFSRYIVDNVKATLFLTGRSKLDDAKMEEIKKLESKGSKVYYLESDITKASDVSKLFKTIKEKVGNLNGIIHSAGVLRDSFIIKKPWEDLKTVLGPKIPGTIYIDKEIANSKLDFFVLFSSAAAVTGNAGQTDYAYANSFMDHFAVYRNGLVERGERQGKTISINWPLWESGGMNIDEKSKQFLYNRTGMLPLKTENGLKALEHAIILGLPQLIVFEGDIARLNQFLKVRETSRGEELSPEKKSKTAEVKVDNDKLILDLRKIMAKVLKVSQADIDNELEFSDYGVDSIVMMDIMNEIEKKYNESVDPNVLSEYNSINQLAEYLKDNTSVITKYSKAETVKKTNIRTEGKIDSKKTAASLVDIFAKLLKVTPDEIDLETEFSDYGVDSIVMMDIMNEIEKKFGEAIEPNVLTEYPTIASLTSYLIENNFIKAEKSIKPIPEESTLSPTTVDSTEISSGLGSRFMSEPLLSSDSGSLAKSNKIAIIGLSCRFPNSNSPESFWENLKSEIDLIKEVGKERWDTSKYFDIDKEASGKSYSKWAGLLDSIEFFDANYFGMKDEDALVMDPQQRIILELSQKLLDNAGLTKNDINKTNTGVYLGISESAYVRNNLDKLSPEYQKHMVLNTIQNMAAARISDFYNLTGNSHTIDTACSSSLVAIHQACQSIINGESEMAIAGGIALIIDQFLHIGFSKAGALSDGPHSYVFDERAKGFVLGEGAGLVLLKSYEKAMADGDRILGTILGSAVNNDGHTMGLTVPSQEGQKAVIQQAIDKSCITPDTISYLEAHGTGTLLGDPIEVKAAGQVYRQYTEEKQYCAVGAVKSNMGHALHAAGVAGLIKILLAMEHKYIPPTLHCEKPHPRFRFEESPFYPVLKGKEWTPYKGVRRAAISSFGFGGTNAHLIIEEAPQDYQSVRKPLPPTQFKHKRYWLGEEIVKVEGSQTMYSYDELLIKLSNGEITPDEMLELEDKGQIIK